jgi:hypothetical protein
MWDYHCKLLADDEEGLTFTKVDNAIRNLYAEENLFLLNVDKGLFALPLARILAETTSTKQAPCRQNHQMGRKHRHHSA